MTRTHLDLLGDTPLSHQRARYALYDRDARTDAVTEHHLVVHGNARRCGRDACSTSHASNPARTPNTAGETALDATFASPLQE